MLTLYIECSDREVQIYNDAYFDINEYKFKFDSTAKNIIKQIDNVKYAGNSKFYSKFDNSLVNVTELSTGCKTALNIYFNPDVVFYIGECGDNAIQVILNLSNGNVFLDDYFIPKRFANKIRVIYNNKSFLINNNLELFDLLNKIYGG